MAPLVGLSALAAMVSIGLLVRAHLGLELSTAGIRDAVARLGWYGPLVFFLLTVFRQFLAIPSYLLLPAGGLCFGTALGTALGGGALVVSGCMKFAIARWVGREWVRERLGDRLAALERRVDRLGPLLIGVSTAHPFGVLSAFHWGAGLSSIRFVPFALAIVLGAPVRAFAYAAFGASLATPGHPLVRVAAIVLVLAAAAPLALPGVRRRLFGAT